jgi:uncharacterized protein (TIGR00251 family)
VNAPAQRRPHLVKLERGISGGVLHVEILVVPRSSRTSVGPMVGDRLRVAVTAPPVDGEANAAVIEVVAEAFGVRRTAVTITRGERGRRKTLAVQGVTASALDELLERAGAHRR